VLRIAKAAKAKIKATTKLEGEELNKEATKLAERIIRYTQPMYSREHRSKIGRSKNVALRLTTAFSSVTNQMNNMLKREYIRYKGSNKTVGDKARMAKNIAIVWQASAIMMAGLDSLRDLAWGKGFKFIEYLKKHIKYSLSPLYFSGPIIASINSIINTMAGIRDPFNVDQATSNLVSGAVGDAITSTQGIVQSVSTDKPTETMNWDRTFRNTFKLVDVIAKVTSGLALKNLYNYTVKMPLGVRKRMMEQNTPLGKAKSEAGYFPKLSRDVNRTVAGKKVQYKIHESRMPKYEADIQSYVEKRLQNTTGRWAGLTKPKKKKDLQKFYYEARIKYKRKLKPGVELIEISKEE